MTPANNRGYLGYRALPEFSTGSNSILPENSSRPKNYVLATLYTHEGVPRHDDAVEEACRENKFPGQHF